MSDFPWLLAMIAVPAVGGVAVAALPKGRDLLVKQVTLAVSGLMLVLAVLATIAFDTGGDRFQLTTSVSWIPAFGVDFALGVDGIALVMLLLIGVLVPVVVVASWEDTGPGGRSMKAYFAWLLVLEAMMVGVFVIIGSFGGPRRQYAAVKFFLYSLLGGLVMLASVIGLYVVSNSQLGEGTFAFDALRQLDIDPGVQKLLFLGFFVAFAIKAPLVPFHTWLPDSGAEAPIGGGVLLVGVLDKVGTFGFIRYCLPLFPDASRTFAPWILGLAVAGILYGALLAMGQSDLKRFVTYTSIAHFGFIALGIFAFTAEGGSGAVLYMVNHGISTGILFLAVGMLISRGGSRSIGDYGGVAAKAPVLAGVFLIAGLSSLALPGTNSFVSEFLVLLGSFPSRPVFTIVATVGIVLAALYVLLVVQRTMHGPSRGLVVDKPFPDLRRRELAVVVPLVVLIIGLGVYPQPLLALIDPAVAATMTDIGSDPGGTPPVHEPATAEQGAN